MGQGMPEPFKHPKSGVYYYRRVVPAPLRAALGRTEYRISLGTKSLPETKRKYPEVAARVDAELAQASGGPVTLSPQQVFGVPCVSVASSENVHFGTLYWLASR